MYGVLNLNPQSTLDLLLLVMTLFYKMTGTEIKYPKCGKWFFGLRTDNMHPWRLNITVMKYLLPLKEIKAPGKIARQWLF